MKQELKCPKCGGTDIEDFGADDTDSYFIDGEEGIVGSHVGACLACGTFLRWAQIYKSCGYEDIEVDED